QIAARWSLDPLGSPNASAEAKLALARVRIARRTCTKDQPLTAALALGDRKVKSSSVPASEVDLRRHRSGCLHTKEWERIAAELADEPALGLEDRALAEQLGVDRRGAPAFAAETDDRGEHGDASPSPPAPHRTGITEQR